MLMACFECGLSTANYIRITGAARATAIWRIF